IRNILRMSSAAMLADDHGTLLTGLEVFGKKEDARSSHIGPDRKLNGVTRPLGFVVETNCPRGEGFGGVGKTSDELFPEGAAVGRGGLRPGLRIRGIGLGPVLDATCFGRTDNRLRVFNELIELASEADFRVELRPRVGQGS